MYITKQNIDTLYEVEAFIDGQLESVENPEYWHDLLSRFQEIRKKADKQFSTQQDNKDVKSLAKSIVKSRL